MRRAYTGFTLIELMTALTVLAVLFAMSVPSFREFTRSNRVTAAHNDLLTAFTVARSEALKRATPVTVCASTDGATCAGVTDWAVGWIVFVDDSGVAGQLDATDLLLQAWPGAGGNLTLRGSAEFVQYTATGRVSPAAAASFDAYFAGCSGKKMRRLGVSPIGALTGTSQACP
jgi:type IV fimbrial biogenesis protein FimT